MRAAGFQTWLQRVAHLLPVPDPTVLVVTDGHAACDTFARAAGISHEAVNLHAGEHVRGALHVQHVNPYHSRFRQWLARFQVVASPYRRRIASSEHLLRAALGSRSNSER